MKVNDLLFSKFVGNALPQAKMVEVERQLINDGEILSAVQASIADYELHADRADELLGIDDNVQQRIEKKSSVNDRNDMLEVSEVVNSETTIKNNSVMNINFSKDEALKVQELVAAFNEKYNQELTLDENLAQFYMNQRPGTFPEDAHEVVKGLHEGINVFNANLQKALSEEGLDYAAELQKATADMPVAEKYEMYLNFLAAITTLSLGNMTEVELAQVEGYQAIREQLKPEGEVTEEMLADVEKRIAEALENNTLCLGSVEALRQLIIRLPEGTEAIEQVITGSEADVRQKLIAAMGTYVMYEKGEIESLKGQELTPESIAVGAAVGIEQANVINDVHTGRTALDVSIRILKIIGGAALLSLFILAASQFVIGVAVMSTAWSICLLGVSSISVLVSVLFGLVVGWEISKLFAKPIGDVMHFSSRVFDSIVALWRQTAWPAIKQTCVSAWKWLRSLVEKKTVVTQTVAAGN